MPKQFRFRFTLALATVVSLGLVSQPFFWRVGAARSLAAAPTLLAPPLTVTNTEDSGSGSLRAAIEAANSSPADDVITFAVSGEIRLTTGELTIADVATGGKLTIQGNGVDQTIISGSERSRVFKVLRGANATFTHLTIEKGKVSGGPSTNSGGGIYNEGTLSVTNSTLSGNWASSDSTPRGGGIFNIAESTGSTATVTITNSTLSGNSVIGSGGQGGGIYNNARSTGSTATVMITNSTLSGNWASSESTNLGGGIFNIAGSTGSTATVTITNSALSGNSVIGSVSQGGGIYNSGGYSGSTATLTITNSTLSGNRASSSNSTGQGGGIYNTAGHSGSTTTVTITNSTLSGNWASTSGIGASFGGGIFNTCGSTGSPATVTITNSTLSGNGASSGSGAGFGGGIFNRADDGPALAEINNSTIANNTANRGGGLDFKGDIGTVTAKLRNTIIARNNATASPDVNGALSSQGNNLLGDSAGSSGLTHDENNDQVGLDPLLDPLGNYGGPTQTMRLQAGSPALDKGATAGAPATDQRGYGRPYNDRVDIGAFERGANEIVPVTETMGLITLQKDPLTEPENAALELIAALQLANDNPALTTIQLKCGTYSYAKAHNWEFGPNALPIIRSPITIEGKGAVLNATHATRLRFFYVAGNGVGGLATGTLTLQNLTLQNGKQKGGDSIYGGGGAGMGGALFNHGTVTLERVTLTGNTATGGSGDISSSGFGGGGMGQDAQGRSDAGFGGAPLGVGGQGGSGSGRAGGGGGGFLPRANGTSASGNDAGNGGGLGLLGGNGLNNGGVPSGLRGDGGGGSDSTGSAETVGGGNYGFGAGQGGGGGVGGGGGDGGGGGFGGGGGAGAGGGFGGGGGNISGGGFGGGAGRSLVGGGGGGLGGALFNHQGTLTLINCTLTNNTARGGNGGSHVYSSVGGNGGSGFGSALFNLNGSVTITSSTLAANTVLVGAAGTGGDGNGAPGTANGGAVYNLAYGNDFTNGGTTTAQVVLRNSILANSTGGSDLVNDRHNGSGTNAATVTFTDSNLVMTKSSSGGATESGPAPLTSNPNLGLLQTNHCQPAVLPLQFPSAAINAATTDPNVTTDQLGVLRQGTAPDLGAYEFTAAPTITPSTTLTVNAGASLTAAPLATVSDADQNRHTLTVTATLQPGNGSGVTLGTISVDSSGNVTANVMADCSATTSTFTLKVTDNGQMFDEQTLTVNVNADVMLPDTNLTGLPGSLSDVNVSFTFSGTDNCTVSRFECKLDNGGWTNCTSGQSYSNLSSGQHTFSVKAIDAAGNEDNSPASYTWTVFAASCGTVVNPVTMPAATKGVPFVQTLSAVPTGSYVFSLLSGQLPPGISLVNTLGIYSLRGTPNTSGRYTFTIKAAKANSTCMGARTYTIHVP